MAVEAENGLRSNLRFANSLGPNTHQKIVNGLAEIAAEKRQKMMMFNEREDPGLSERLLFEQGKLIVDFYLNRAKLAMGRIGFTEAETLERLPPPAQIVFRNHSEGNGGNCDQYGQYIWIHLMENQTIANPETAETFYHEVGHFITDKILGTHNGYHSEFGSIKLKHIADGFDTSGRNNVRRRGLYGESLATIFSLECIDDSKFVLTPFNHIPFMLAFIGAFARKADIESVEAFRQLFKANATADFSFHRKIVDKFGVDTVLGLNTISQVNDQLDKDTLMRVALLGGFSKNYSYLLEGFDNGEVIGLRGLKGGFKADTRNKLSYFH